MKSLLFYSKRFYSFCEERDGQMTLPFVLLIGGVIVEVAIAGAFVTYFLSNSGYGERLSIRANAAAESGIRDAMIKITQNKEYAAGGEVVSYVLPVSPDNNDSASVTVSRSIEGTRYLFNVTSLGVAGSRQKKFVATIFVNISTGEVQLESIKESAIE